jgi:hypothetical protein
MLRSALGEVKGVLDGRFLLTFFFPCFVFWGLVLLVWQLPLGTWEGTARAWSATPEGLKIVEVVGFLAVVTVSSLFLSASMNSLLRIYEGYWSGWFRWLLYPLRRYHERRFAALEARARALDPAGYEELYLNYPPPGSPDEVRPTLFGNVLRNAESYPRVRYRIDTVLIWSRLYHLLPKTFVANVSAARAAVEQMIILSALGVAFAAFSAVYLGWANRAGWRWLGSEEWWGCVLGGLAVAYLAYLFAVGSVRVYGNHLKAAFDLHRNALLKQLRLPLPTTLEEERDRWSEVCLFFYRNVLERPQEWTYLPPEKPDRDKDREEDGEKSDDDRDADKEKEDEH